MAQAQAKVRESHFQLRATIVIARVPTPQPQTGWHHWGWQHCTRSQAHLTSGWDTQGVKSDMVIEATMPDQPGEPPARRAVSDDDDDNA
mmetsp:Transcript_19567/g.33820  ORF Transcript_19567/g.33820 Transcript_19567/m.33820 type:complete len:89 (+) Transcript_19567:1024-1290(+)